jgi:hypothetical protein
MNDSNLFFTNFDKDAEPPGTVVPGGSALQDVDPVLITLIPFDIRL